MKVLSITALPLVAMLAIPGSAMTGATTATVTPSGVRLAHAVPTMQADRLIAVQSQLGFTMDPYQDTALSITMPRHYDPALFRG